MIALNEERAAEVLLDGGRRDGCRVLGRSLLRVTDLRARDLEDDRAGVELLGGPHGGTRHVVGEGADVDRRDGEAAAFTAAARLVHRKDRCRRHPDGLADAPDQPATGVAYLRLLGEDRVAGDVLGDATAQPLGVLDRDRAGLVYCHDAANGVPQALLVEHRRPPEIDRLWPTARGGRTIDALRRNGQA